MVQKKKNTKKQNTTQHVHRGIYVVVSIIIVLGLGLFGGYIMGKHSKKQDTETSKSDKHTKDDQSQHEATPSKTITELTCNADELALDIAPSEDGASAGTMQYAVTMENTSDRICTLYGYPGVSLVNQNGNQIGEPAERADGAKEQLSLNPGQKAQSIISMPNSGNFPEGECKDGATKIRVYPPNDTGYISIASDIRTWCKGFSVLPVTAL